MIPRSWEVLLCSKSTMGCLTLTKVPNLHKKKTWWSLATLSNSILVSYKASFHLIKSHIYLGTWKRENILWKQTFQKWIPTHLRTQHTAIPSFKLGNLLSTNSSLKIPSYVKSVQDYNSQSTGTWQWNQCSLSPSTNLNKLTQKLLKILPR
jgi:hypothetical protein